jgi:ComEC/Rec2-related protein
MVTLTLGNHLTLRSLLAASLCTATLIILLIVLFFLMRIRIHTVWFFLMVFIVSFLYASLWTVSFPYPFGVPVRAELRLLSDPRIRQNALEYTARIRGTVSQYSDIRDVEPSKKLRFPKQRVLLHLPIRVEYPQRGDIVSVRGLFSDLPQGRSGEYALYLKSRGIQVLFEGSSRDFRVVRRVPIVSFVSMSNRLKAYVRRVNDRLLLWPHTEFATALLTGNRDDLPWELAENFRRSGTMHILAVSGLHIGFLVFFFLFLCKILRINQSASHMALILAVLFYMVFIGDAPSVKRASLMVLCGIVLFLFDRDRNYLNVLAVAFNILWIANPLSIINPGFILSFTATFAILFLVPHVQRVFVELIPQFISIPIALSVGIQVYLLPVMLSFFGSFSYITVIANLPIVPLAGLALALEIFTLLLYPVLLPASVIVAEVNIVVMSTIFRLAGLFARVPPFEVRTFPKILIPVYFLTLTGILVLLFYRGRINPASQGN